MTVKTLLTYYGGKQCFANYIASFIPKDCHYVEPFAGGAAVFFEIKRQQKGFNWSLNDLDNLIYTTYKVCKEQPNEVIRKIQAIPYSQYFYKEAYQILNNETSSDLDKAVSVIYLSRAGFASAFIKNTGFGYQIGVKSKDAQKWKNLKKDIDILLSYLDDVQLFNEPAEHNIQRLDSRKTIFYCDPPYPTARQEYNHQYSKEDFNNLCRLLEEIKGRYILSCYHFDGIEPPNNSIKIHKSKVLTASKAKNGKREYRTEILFVHKDLERKVKLPEYSNGYHRSRALCLYA